MKQSHKIIMLPSEKKSILYKRNDLDTLHLGDFSYCNKEDALRTNQHLYVLSDEEPKVGEWTILSFGGNSMVVQMQKGESGGVKIIATTDPELIKIGVAPIHKYIIEAYVKKPFDEVMVEYDSIPADRAPNGWDTFPKLNQDGTLAVSLVEENSLDAYLKSRERILSSQANDSESPIQHQLEARNKLAEVRQTLKWIKENL